MISRQLGGRLIALVALPLVVLCVVTLLLSAGEQIDQAILQRLLLGALILSVVWSALVGADLLRALRTVLGASDSAGTSTKAVVDVGEPVQSTLKQTSVDEIDQQIETVDELQRDEEDPDRLQQLFSLDQSLARLRRAARGLATMTDPVAVDYQPPTEAASSVALLDVLTSALGSVEHFERVQIGQVADLICTNDLGEDLSHLISELIDLGGERMPSDQTIELAAGLSSSGDKLLIQVLDGRSAPATQLQTTNHLFSNPLQPIDDPSQVGLAIASRLVLRMQGSLVAEPGRDGRTLTTAALDASLFPPRPGEQRPPLGPGAKESSDTAKSDDRSSKRPRELDYLNGASGPSNDEPIKRSAENTELPKTAYEQPPDVAPAVTLRDALGNPADFETGIEALLDGETEVAPNEPQADLSDPDKSNPDESNPNESSPAEPTPDDADKHTDRTPDEVRSRLTNYREGLESGRNHDERPGSESESAGATPPKYPKPQRGPRPGNGAGEVPSDATETPQLPDEEES